MKRALLVCGLSAVIASSLTLIPSPSSAKTVAACVEEWKANKSTIQTSGKTRKDFITECRAETASTEPAPAPTPQPTQAEKRELTATAAPETTAAAKHKTIKACAAEWTENKATIQASGKTRKDFITECRTGTETALHRPHHRRARRRARRQPPGIRQQRRARRSGKPTSPPSRPAAKRRRTSSPSAAPKPLRPNPLQRRRRNQPPRNSQTHPQPLPARALRKRYEHARTSGRRTKRPFRPAAKQGKTSSPNVVLVLRRQPPLRQRLKQLLLSSQSLL